MKILLFFFLTCHVAGIAVAQQPVKGYVLDLAASEPMAQVEVKNLKTQLKVITDKEGAFSITANKNELLSFEYPGYRVDTLLITDYGVKRVYLTAQTGSVMLNEVLVEGMNSNRLEEEKQLARQNGQITSTVKGGGLAISPSRIFGKEGRTARRQYRMLQEEEETRAIEARFTRALITKLTPLAGDELEQFITKYRPKLSFIERADDEDLKLYIIDAYGRFKKEKQP